MVSSRARIKGGWLDKYQYDEEDKNALTTAKSSAYSLKGVLSSSGGRSSLERASSTPGTIASFLKQRRFLFIGFVVGVLLALILVGIVAIRKMIRMRRGAMSSKEEGSLDRPKKGSKEANAENAE
ncbi:unnamed protein product [Cylicocyclus nassatus]|uniref:Uncharacterized protein n=1 Tax=Cylicocyclus nassatus TaxID=53992 RepID=A0AA36H8V3_CYLNA|nr:unnamed protein product [Cylicocyclus nassatus]